VSMATKVNSKVHTPVRRESRVFHTTMLR
jgi:hypothetical protein